VETYYKPEDLPKFEEIGKAAPDLAKKFFEYYNAVFAEGALTEREKALGEGIQPGRNDRGDSCGDSHPWRSLPCSWCPDAQCRPETLHVKGGMGHES
jgi:hypothetical protein